jgi:thiamine-monophosphate kinase
VVGLHRCPNPPAPRGYGAGAPGRGARAAIDISDGLLADAAHVAAASNVCVRLDLDRVPCVDGVDPVSAARSGEEYELLLTSAIPIDCGAFANRFDVQLTEIGMVIDGEPGIEPLLHGEPVDVVQRGYDHFGRA